MAHPHTHTGADWLLADPDPAGLFIPEDFGGEALALSRAAAEFIEGEILPRTDAIERQEPGLTPELIRHAGELGLMGLDVPEEYGGLGLDLLTSCLLTEQMGRQASFAVSHGAHAGIGTLPLVWFGTDEQKRRYLPGIASGQTIAAFALSEAGYGSDALGAATRARLSEDGTHYVLNGTKMWTSNAAIAGLFTLFAQVEPGPGVPEGRTFTAFLVERDFPGVSIGREEHKLGIKGSSTCRVLLEDARVPVENVLHQVGKGHVVALNVLNAGRLKLGAGMVGPCRDLIRISARYANERHQMGHPISHFGLIRHKLAEQAVRLYATESACYRVAGMVQRFLEGRPESGGDVPPRAEALEEFLIECAVVKVLASEALDYVVDEAVQIHGGYGYTEEFPVARAYRDARINRIFEGTNEINRLTIAGTLLRRAQRGRLALIPAIRGVTDELLSSPAPRELPDSPLGEERAALADARKLLLAACGTAAERWGESLGEQQEILGCLADGAIDLFTAQSAVLRAERLSGDRAAVAAAMARVYCADALERLEANVRRVLAAAHTGDELRSRLALLRRYSRRLPVDTVTLRRQVAEAVVRSEAYPFSRS